MKAEFDADFGQMLDLLGKMEVCMKRNCARERRRAQKLAKSLQAAKQSIMKQLVEKKIDIDTEIHGIKQLNDKFKQSQEAIALEECRFKNCCSEVVAICQEYVSSLQKDCESPEEIPTTFENHALEEMLKKNQQRVCAKLVQAQALLKQSPVPFRQLYKLMETYP